MQISSKRVFFATLVASAAAMTGCASSMIGERIGADQIVVAQPVHVSQCKSLGKHTYGVMAKYGVVMTRSSDDIEANLLQMARNGAVDLGGDTVVKGNSSELGKRTYETFKCKR